MDAYPQSKRPMQLSSSCDSIFVESDETWFNAMCPDICRPYMYLPVSEMAAGGYAHLALESTVVRSVTIQV